MVEVTGIPALAWLSPFFCLGGAGMENALPELAKPPASSVLVLIPDRLKCVGVEVEAMDMDIWICRW
jgi:hypothetical protein